MLINIYRFGLTLLGGSRQLEYSTGLVGYL